MWQQIDNKLYKKFVFKNFVQAFAFISQVAIEAEKANHHPSWQNTWNTVEIWLCTHDSGNVVTQKDIDLADTIDGLLT